MRLPSPWHVLCIPLVAGCYLGPPWSVTLNTPPAITFTSPEDDRLVFDEQARPVALFATDDDDDALTFSWLVDGRLLLDGEFEVIQPSEPGGEWRTYTLIHRRVRKFKRYM